MLLRVRLILCISSGRYVSFNEDFNVEKCKEVSLMDISGLNVDLALHDVMEIYICTPHSLIYHLTRFCDIAEVYKVLGTILM